MIRVNIITTSTILFVGIYIFYSKELSPLRFELISLIMLWVQTITTVVKPENVKGLSSEGLTNSFLELEAISWEKKLYI